jgi:hypothetical protein
MIVIGDRVKNFFVINFLEIALNLCDGTNKHGGNLYNFLDFIFNIIFRSIIDMYTFIIGYYYC